MSESTRVADAPAPEYWAFISYSHQDKRIARLLRAQLAQFRIPRHLRNQVASGDSRLRAVFLDEDEAGARAHVSDLEGVLDASRALIVICSHYAVESKYVADEIEYFRSSGRGDRIFALIASGEPNATAAGRPGFECIPESLRASPPLAPNLGQETPAEWKNAVEKIAAAILGLSASQLIRKRERERRIRWLALGSAVTLAIALWAAFLMPSRTYARSYVRRWGQWEEIDKISRHESQKLPMVYEFERRGFLGRTRRVRLVNASGTCPQPGFVNLLGDTLADKSKSGRGCEVLFRYALDGSIQEESVLDQFGNVIETLSYTTRDVALFTEKGFGSSRSRTGIRYVRFTRQEGGSGAGTDLRLDFLDEQREPRLSNEGAYGLLKEYDVAGRVIRRTLLGRDGRPHIGNGGFAAQVFRYDARGCEMEQKLIGLDEHSAVSAEGWSIIKQTCDSSVRTVAIRFLDNRGMPTTIRGGYAGVDFQLDAKGQAARIWYRDKAGAPTLTAELIAGKVQKFDERGYLLSVTCVGRNGLPTLHRNGSAVLRYRRDRFGAPLEEMYAGLDGRPTLNVNGYAVAAYTYDKRGNVLETVFYDRQRSRTYGPNGWSAAKASFDGSNHMTKVDFYDTADRPTLDSSGAGGRRFRFDAHGNQVEESVVDTRGLPSVDNHGVSARKTVIDRLGRRSETHFLRLDGSPIDPTHGFSIVRIRFDELNRDVGQSFFTTAGSSSVNHEGIASYVDTLDAHGRLLKRSFFDAGGKAVSNRGFGFEKTYSPRGEEIEYRHMDASGRLAKGPENWAIRRSVFDDAGNVISQRFLGITEQPVMTTMDYAGLDHVFDERRRIIRGTYLGTDGRPYAGHDGVAAWASKYDDRDNEIERVFLDEREKITHQKDSAAIVQSRYDDRRRRIATVLYDADRRLMRHPLEFWTTNRMQYDDRGRIVSRAYFDEKGQPVALGGYAERRTVYDERGNAVEERYFDEKARPVGKLWAARLVRTFNLQGKEVERRFFDGDGQPFVHPKSGRAIVKLILGVQGNVLEEQCFGLNGKPVDRKDERWFRKVYTYSPAGQEISRKCHDVKGRDVLPCPPG